MSDWLIQTSFLGDAVLTLPLVHRILESGRTLVVVAAPRNVAVFERARENGLARWKENLKIEIWDKRQGRGPWQIYRLAKRLVAKHRAPERVFCVQRSFSTGLLAVFSRASVRIGFATGGASFFYSHAVARDWESSVHEIDKNLNLLRVLQSVEPWTPESSPSLLRNSADLPTTRDAVAFSLYSPWATKIWDLGQTEVLLKNLIRRGKEIWFLGDPSFALAAVELEQKLNSKLFKNFVGRTNLSEWMDKISAAEILISGDSAAVHVANDLGVPTVALFGPTVVEFGFGPWRKNSIALGVDLPCRPCDIHGPRSCPLGHHNCMKFLKADWVEAATNDLTLYAAPGDAKNSIT